jgi:hypothetical protein
MQFLEDLVSSEIVASLSVSPAIEALLTIRYHPNGARRRRE